MASFGWVPPFRMEMQMVGQPLSQLRVPLRGCPRGVAGWGSSVSPLRMRTFLKIGIPKTPPEDLVQKKMHMLHHRRYFLELDQPLRLFMID